ncbi:glycoside hydrolase family 78 protein [Deinococcus roseus]|uniref:alpha-L-rhamnosidase n=1 Tax=Deinococcus roseus TaxID=392414 RepID=A0ABQ2DFU0_9DEIO|nr:glycoside hydrolase family 78 protein [Deinococcus roseus]GGJ56029.1 alpha-L-rhamnosidase [Deinococcus roseus]
MTRSHPHPPTVNPDRPSMTTITGFHAEHHPQAHPGLGTGQPRLSWKTHTETSHWLQTHFEIEAVFANGEHHTTGQVSGRESVLVDWPFRPLKSREKVTLQVRTTGNDGHPSEWSAPLTLEAGLLESEDWTAQMVGPRREEDPQTPGPAPLLRKHFNLPGHPRLARLYITSLGLHDTRINGQRVSDQLFSPGWTSYTTRLRYHTFDVTGLLKKGENAIGTMLGNGWYRGRLGFGGGRRNLYGNTLGLLAQLEVELETGQTVTLTTDDSWTWSEGPIQFDDIYDGERYDARKEQPGWDTADFDDQGWKNVQTLPFNFTTLVAPEGPPVRRIESVKVQEVIQTPSGKTVLDFGQNLVGWLNIKVRGERGHTVTLRHAEVLENGELGIRPLRHAANTDTYTLKGNGVEVYEPHFTFHGFRYAQIENWPGELNPADIEAVVVHSDLERTGWFECSDPLINQFHQNVVWGMRGNFLDVPTDCPQRDERMGWTGDIQAFAPTASFLYDTRGFLSSWLRDLQAEQSPEGVVPFVVPNVLEFGLSPVAAWSDAATIVPWTQYQRFGDTGILKQQFESMKRWVDCLVALTGERKLWDMGFQYGDWLDPDAPPERPENAKTPAAVVATAYFARSAQIVADAARVLGRDTDQVKYSQLAQQVRDAFQREYVTPSGRVLGDATTAYSLALEFQLINDGQQRQLAGRRLADLVRVSKHHISTGFVGTPIICDALCSVGEVETAHLLLTQTECPSWLYPVTMGATTVWERWDSMLPDGTINPGEMTSFNHYALGAVADFLHRCVAGLAPAGPGYREIRFQPQVQGKFTSAAATFDSPYGRVESRWKVEGGTLECTVILPPNTTGTVHLPARDAIMVGSGTHHFQLALPQTQPPRLTWHTRVRDLLDQRESYRGFLRVLGSHSEDAVRHFDSGTAGILNFTLEQAVPPVPNQQPLRERIQQWLDQHNP